MCNFLNERLSTNSKLEFVYLQKVQIENKFEKNYYFYNHRI